MAIIGRLLLYMQVLNKRYMKTKIGFNQQPNKVTTSSSARGQICDATGKPLVEKHCQAGLFLSTRNNKMTAAGEGDSQETPHICKCNFPRSD